MTWTQEPRVAFDLETTGKNPLEARIVTASILYIEPNGTISDTREWLVDPGVEIPEGAAKIHGITTEHAQEHGRPAEVGISEIMTVLTDYSKAGVPIIGHNLSYDLTVLAAEVYRHQLEHNPTTLAPILDSMIIEKQANKFVRGSNQRTLINTAARYGVALSEEDAHGSTADCYASERIMAELARRYPAIDVHPMRLHNWQIRWAEDQGKSLQEYFDNMARVDPETGKRVVVNLAWPVQDLPDDMAAYFASMGTPA